MSDTNLTVNRLIIALLNFHIPPPSLEEEMEESITGRTDVARGDHPEFGSQKMQKTQAKDAMMTYLPAHCIIALLIQPFPMLLPFAACFGHEYSYLRQLARYVAFLLLPCDPDRYNGGATGESGLLQEVECQQVSLHASGTNVIRCNV